MPSPIPSASTHVKETEMRRSASVLIASGALVAALGSPAIADDNIVALIPIKLDNTTSILNNPSALNNPSVLNDADVLDDADVD
jgi:hypothetical protein